MDIFYFSWRIKISIHVVIDLHRIVCFINLTLIWRYLDVSNTYEITRMNISFRERFH